LAPKQPAARNNVNDFRRCHTKLSVGVSRVITKPHLFPHELKSIGEPNAFKNSSRFDLPCFDSGSDGGHVTSGCWIVLVAELPAVANSYSTDADSVTASTNAVVSVMALARVVLETDYDDSAAKVATGEGLVDIPQDPDSNKARRNLLTSSPTLDRRANRVTFTSGMLSRQSQPPVAMAKHVTDCGWISCSFYLSRSETHWVHRNLALAQSGGYAAAGVVFCGIMTYIGAPAALFVGVSCGVFWAVYGGFLWNALNLADASNGCLRIQYAFGSPYFYSGHSGNCHDT
jgi:hypothetical protein